VATGHSLIRTLPVLSLSTGNIQSGPVFKDRRDSSLAAVPRSSLPAHISTDSQQNHLDTRWVGACRYNIAAGMERKSPARTSLTQVWRKKNQRGILHVQTRFLIITFQFSPARLELGDSCVWGN